MNKQRALKLTAAAFLVLASATAALLVVGLRGGFSSSGGSGGDPGDRDNAEFSDNRAESGTFPGGGGGVTSSLEDEVVESTYAMAVVDGGEHAPTRQARAPAAAVELPDYPEWDDWVRYPEERPYAVSTFECLSIYWKPAGDDEDDLRRQTCGVQYRAEGSTEWRTAQDLWYDDTTDTRWDWRHSFRGSIVGLAPGTVYEVKLTLSNGVTETLEAKTWDERFPVKKVIRVGSQSTTFTTTEGGDEESGYVVYDGQGSTIDVANEHEACIEIVHRFVIIRNFVVKGAQQDGIRVMPRVKDVVIEDCDISDWGAIRKKSEGGSPAEYFGNSHDGGIDLAVGAYRVVIQGNRIHHPRYASNTWGEDGHPWGPSAVFINTQRNNQNYGNHVIRFNEVYSDRARVFEDCLRADGDFSADGFPGGDSDVYGNYATHAADNALQIEGGGRNVRVWANYISESYTGIATVAVRIGPLYVFRNVGDKFHDFDSPGRAARHFKTGYKDSEGRQFFYHNVNLRDDPLAMTAHGPQNMVSKNNIFWGKADGSTDDSVFEYNLHSGSIPGSSSTNIKAAPQFASGPGRHGHYRLEFGAPGHDAGVPLPNFNDGYMGPGPDMGAHERATDAMRFGIDAWEHHQQSL